MYDERLENMNHLEIKLPDDEKMMDEEELYEDDGEDLDDI